MRLLRVVLVAVPLAASLAFTGCGGRVGGAGGGSSSGGGSGSSSGTFPGCPAPDDIAQGGTCLAPGQECSTGVSTGCASGGSIPNSCTCSSEGTWSCDLGGPACPVPSPVCPVASSIVGGRACQVESTLSCASSMRVPTCSGAQGGPVYCECEGGFWACSEIGPLCEPDAGEGCPAPADIHAGDGCGDDGEQCPGNPQLCEGSTLYDAFECESGVWHDVARTVCDVDAHGR